MINIPTIEQLGKLPRLYETEGILPKDKIGNLSLKLTDIVVLSATSPNIFSAGS